MSQTPRSSELVAALAREFASAVGAMAGGSGALEPADIPADPIRWLIVLGVSGSETGRLVIGLPETAGRELTGRIMGLDEPAPDGAVTDTLQEFGGQAAGALGQESVAAGLKFAVSLEDASGESTDDAVGFTIPLGDEAKAAFAVWGAVETLAPALETGPVDEPVIDSSRKTSEPLPMPAGTPANLDVILDIDLPVTVRFGVTDLPLNSLARLGPGSIIDLARSPDDPVDLLVSGKVVARGEVVVVSGNYGVRILEVVSTADRIRSMGA
ncbi:MAG: FliM/FliN family flagellar motor switch protein [Vicinamibacterales bacterium]